MIPKKLTIKGLYSYSEEAIIDFEQLSQAHIFGIFGNVGSGKSAILEAMMLALYGEVPRLGHGKGDNRNFNMMNLKSNDLSVDFEFEAAGKKYRSIVETKRHAKKFEDVASPKYRRYAWDEEMADWAPHNFEPADVIGLKLEHFTKTIIVPQNQFQEFLQLKDTERSKMMSDLFNLERFDLAKKAVSLENKNKLKVNEVQVQLEQIGDVTKEQIEEIKGQLSDLELLTANDSILIKEKQQEENEAQQLKKQFDTLIKLQNQITEFEKQTPQYNALEKQLTDYDYCQLHFQHLMEQNNNAINSVNKNNQLLVKKQTEFTENETVLEQIKTQYQLLRFDFDNRHDKLREADELSSILIIQKAEKIIEDTTKRVVNGLNAIQNKSLEIDNFRAQRTAIETERATLKSPNVLELNALKDWFSKYNGLNKEIETLNVQVVQLNESLDTIEIGRHRLVTTDLPLFGENYPLSISLAEAILALKKGIQNKELAKNNANKNMQHELAVLKLENLATNLNEGEPCPLCGSVHHPEVMNVTDVQSIINNIQKEIAHLDEVLKSLQNIQNQLETHKINFNKIQQDRKDILNKIADKRIELERHAATFHWTNFSKNDEAAVNTAFANAAKTLKRIDEVTISLQEITKKIDKETATLNTYQKKIGEFNAEIAAKSSEKQTLENQLQVLKGTDFAHISETEMTKRQSAIREAVKKLEQNYAHIEKQVKERTEIAAILRGGILELEHNKITFDKQLLEATTALDKRLAASVFTDIQAVKAVLALKLNIELEKKRLNTFRADSLAAQKAQHELAEELKEKNYSMGNHQFLRNEIQELNEKIETQNRHIGGLRTTIADKEKKLARKNELETERRALEQRGKSIGELKRLFYASGFVSYVSTVFLKNLCETANERFRRLTNQRLCLEITADNTFLVRDLLNDGQTRHVKTLSGGQTFQAALSLALALADNIQSLTKSPQNFFFLDEGFGSLDKDSLQIVFETLKSLRRENRIVGVISHVEEMQQEIERYVRVVLDEEKGSQLSYF